jgi:hypothetical protein
MFGDGSREAYATLAYIRWVLDNVSVECKLIAGKSRVAPKQKISIPRMDSSAILGMLRCDSMSFLEFVGTRVSQVKPSLPLKRSGSGSPQIAIWLIWAPDLIWNQGTCKRALTIKRAWPG